MTELEYRQFCISALDDEATMQKYVITNHWKNLTHGTKKSTTIIMKG